MADEKGRSRKLVNFAVDEDVETWKILYILEALLKKGEGI